MVNYRPVSLLPICGKIFERLTQFLSSFRKTNYFLLINLFFDQMALVKINCCELLIVLMQILIKVLHLKEELTSQISQKPLIRCGTRDYYTNQRLLDFQPICTSLFKVSSVIGSREQFSTVSPQIGRQSWQEFHRAQNFGLCSSWYI